MSPLHEQMLQTFEGAAKERRQRQETVKDPLNPRIDVPAWVLYERKTMLGAVNAERAKRGRGPIDMARLHREENQAWGHSDYARKYALYCSWLVDAP